MAHSKVSDKGLLRQIADGNVNAFEMLFKQHYENLCRYACTFVRDCDEAEDIVQKTFVSFWEKRSDIAVETSLKSYLYRAVRNAALNNIKHQQVRQKHAASMTIDDHVASQSASDGVVSAELNERINTAIERLPEQCRRIFELSRFEGLKYSEIAEQLGISVKTVENQMGKALRRMRDELHEYLPILIILGYFSV